MTENDLIKAIDEILDDKDLKAELGISKHDKQNIIKRRSIPKMLEILFKANRLQLKDGPSTPKK